MRDNDGRRLDHATLEVLRLRAVEQVEAGEHPEDVARALGMHRKTVYRWLKAKREGGAQALLAKPVPGSKPKLTAEQKRRVHTLVSQCEPRQLGLASASWTRATVGELIFQEYGIRLSLPTIGNLLHSMDLSPHQPLRRAAS